MNSLMRWKRLPLSAGLLLATAAGLAWSSSAVLAGDPGADAAPAAEVAGLEAAEKLPTTSDFARKLWEDAKHNRESALRETLGLAPDDPDLSPVLASLESTLSKRESTREEKLNEARTKLAEKIADPTDKRAISDALRYATELYMLSPDKGGFLMDPQTVSLIDRAEAAAREAEAAEDWFMTNELFFRLHVLLEEQGRFKADFERVSKRLGMMRLYVPETFWEMRNRERQADGKPPLPPYNGLGESYQEKLRGIDKFLVVLAASAAENQQIDRVPLRELMSSGIESIKILLTTSELKAAFPSLADEDRRMAMLNFLDDRLNRVRTARKDPDRTAVSDMLDDIMEMNSRTVAVMPEAILHEFGNGAMARLDDFSAIIWPDEVARFDRMTSGVFVGVGIQIQLDDETQMIKVVTPLEGTPAQQAGVQKDDLIKKINGESAVGISLNQAVDLITGLPNTNVTLTLERQGAELDLVLTRKRIEQVSVKGWRRTGVHEDDWDWFIDPNDHIGYIRLTSFTDKTTAELRDAVSDMRKSGLRGLILDLRFNPGGLLNEAVSVSNLFVKRGPIVSTVSGQGSQATDRRSASSDPDKITDVPVAVLINEGSASASEIVSGAIRHYADRGEIDAILVGQRSYGKGSVQNVWPVGRTSKMKLTTQYYTLPDGRIIHKRPGDSDWGVSPHLAVDMLPQQTSDALKFRQEVDVMPMDASGRIIEADVSKTNPSKLLDDGMDPQLQWALVLLKSRAVAAAPAVQDHAQRVTP